MRISKAIVVAMGAAVLMTSCTEEQSSFNINSIPDSGVIEGVVTYNQGTKLVDGKFVYDYKPCADLKMVALVENSSYGSDLSGTTRYDLTTDAEGKYSLEVPALVGKDVRVTFYTYSFRGTRSVIKIENNKLVTIEEPVVYAGRNTATVTANGVEYSNFSCVETSVDRPVTGFTEYASVKGRLGQNAYKYTKGDYKKNYNDEIIGRENSTIEAVFVGAPNTDLILNVDYDGQAFVYNTTTDANGNYSLQVPVSAFPAAFDCNVNAVTYNGKFTMYEEVIKTYNNEENNTYIDYEPRTLNGYYSQQFRVNHSLSFPVSGVTEDVEDKTMIFNVIGDNEYNYNGDLWSPYTPWLEDTYPQE